MKNNIMIERYKSVLRCRHMLWDITLSQLKAKYANLKLGIWWIVIIPLSMAFFINFIFSKVFKVDIPHYALFVLSAIIPWFFVSQAVSEATNVFNAHKSILRQAIFPREIIVISIVLSNFINFMLSFMVLMPLFLFFNKSILFQAHFFILTSVLILLLAVGLSFIFSTLNVFFRDVSHFLPTGFMFWFWITPVFYSETMLQYPYRYAILFNPVTCFVSAYRSIFYLGEPLTGLEIIFLILISFSVLIIGYIFYIKNESEVLKKI